MNMTGRKYQATPTSTYRYSINGQEKSDELNENLTTAMYWEYDSRIGRRWNVDPKPNFAESPYLCFSGNPILINDIFGDVGKVGTNTDDKVKAGGKEYKKQDLVDKLVNDMSKISGLKLSVDPKTGVLVNNGVSTNKGISKTARKEILDLIASPDEINIDFSSQSSETFKSYDGSAFDNKIILLNPSQIDANIKGTSKDLNNKTFGYAMTTLHEMGHTTLHGSFSHQDNTLKSFGVIDDPDIIGNKIRTELGTNWGQRLSYVSIYLNGKDYLPMNAKSTAILQIVATKILEVGMLKQQWLSAGGLAQSVEYFKKYEKAKKELNSLPVPKSGVVASQHDPSDKVEY
jgi:hypothetical protein